MKNAELIKLTERYPYMFSAPDTALELYLGWMGLLSDLCLEIDAMLGEGKRGFQWTRIREKAGIYRLGYRMDGRARWTAFLKEDGGIDHRFEPTNADAIARAIEIRVLAATEASRICCVICGAKGTLAGDRMPWIVLCPSHAENAFREGGVTWADAKVYDSRKANLELEANAEKHLPVPTVEESSRLAEFDTLAIETFETEEEAALWLRKPHPMLEGNTPLQALATSHGAKRVREILVSIKYGGAT